MLAGLLITGGAGSSWAYVGGDLTNQLVGATYSLIGGSGDPTTVGTEGHAWSSTTFTPGTTSSSPEFSASFDWSGTASPQRDVRTLLMFPNQVSGDMNFSVYSSTTTPASPYSLATNETVAVGQLLGQKLDQQGVTGIKFEDVQNGTSTTRRDIGGLVALAENLDFVQPATATASQTLNDFYNSGNPINVNSLVDGSYSTGVSFGGEPGLVGSVADAYVEVTFATATNLVGVLVVLDSWPQGRWRTWEVRDLNDNVLATSQVGVAGSPTASSDQYQLLGFTGGAQTLTGFRIYGTVGHATQNNTNNRIKEIVGLSVPPPPPMRGSVLIVR
jgi:hypothetical protein